MILSNKAFQAFLWPAIQFYGGIGIISLLYPLILFGHQLGISGICMIGVVIFATAATSCSMIGLGKQTIIRSTKILRHAKSWNDCPEQRKFLQSCPTIAIRVGEFHKMDNGRVPAFIRFILQRTFFFVLKTKLSFVNEYDINVNY